MTAAKTTERALASQASALDVGMPKMTTGTEAGSERWERSESRQSMMKNEKKEKAVQTRSVERRATDLSRREKGAWTEGDR